MKTLSGLICGLIIALTSHGYAAGERQCADLFGRRVESHVHSVALTNVSEPAKLRTVETARAGDYSLAQRAFGSLPKLIRKPLAKALSPAKTLEIETLQREIADLMPPEAVNQLNNLYQPSYDYLLEPLPAKQTSQLRLMLGLKIGNDSASRNEGSDANIEYWLSRFQKTNQLLKELVALQDQRGSSDQDLAATYLSLGMLHAYSYGFEARIAGRKVTQQLNGFDKSRGRGSMVFSAVDHYLKAIELFEKDDGLDSFKAQKIRYLLLRHANNGMRAFNNSHSSSMDTGLRTPPAPEYLQFETVAETQGQILAKFFGAKDISRESVENRILSLQVQYETQQMALLKAESYSPIVAPLNSNLKKRYETESIKLLLKIVTIAPPGWITTQLQIPRLERTSFLQAVMGDALTSLRHDKTYPYHQVLYDMYWNPEKYDATALIEALRPLAAQDALN